MTEKSRVNFVGMLFSVSMAAVFKLQGDPKKQNP